MREGPCCDVRWRVDDIRCSARFYKSVGDAAFVEELRAASRDASSIPSPSAYERPDQNAEPVGDAVFS